MRNQASSMITGIIALHRTTSQNDEIFTKEYEKLHRKTLGGLIKEARASAIFTESSNENLKLILEFRNWMVHHIARDMLGYVVQENGMKNLEHNLREIAVFFNEASEMCGQEIQRIIKDRGINLEPWQKVINEALDAQF